VNVIYKILHLLQAIYYENKNLFNIREKVPENPLIWNLSGKKCPIWSGKIDLTINGYASFKKELIDG